MAVLNDIFQNLQDRFFDSIVSNRLVYNSCWEDPRIDRELLQIDRDSSVVMLTSAGCNALDYLLDKPRAIHCVDANPAQNALLEFKKVLFTEGDYETLWKYFGRGYDTDASLHYHRNLRPELSTSARRFWDRRHNCFTPTAAQPTFYFGGTSGKIALMFYNRIKRKGLYGSVLNLLDSRNLSEQRYYFKEIDPQLWSPFLKWLSHRNATLAMLGVPATQREMIDRDFEGGIFGFIRDSIRTVFTELPLRDNYFWRVYMTGSYTPRCCPNYLKESNFGKIAAKIDRIHLHNSYLSTFLEKNPGNYSHYVLLDHQDWMAHTYPEMLAEEWKLILKNSRPGSRILFRSAAADNDFLPDFVHERLTFEATKTERLHRHDRVGTYASTHLGIVN